jgi:hypothetical protein
MITQVEGTTDSGMPGMTDGESISLMASKQDTKGDEGFTADQMSAPFLTRWTTSYHRSIDPDLVESAKKYVLQYENRRYDVQSVSVIGRRDCIEILTIGRQG